MRRSLLLIPLPLAGCKPGRQAAVSNDGRWLAVARPGVTVRISAGG